MTNNDYLDMFYIGLELQHPTGRVLTVSSLYVHLIERDLLPTLAVRQHYCVPGQA